MISLQKNLNLKPYLKSALKYASGNIRILILVFITFLSCSEKTIRKDECLVICEIKNAVGKKYYIKELDIKDINTIDSALIREEAKPIIFKIDVPVPGLYAITDAGDGYIPIVLKNGEQIKISADGDKLQTGFQLEGSEESEVLFAYFQFNNRNLDKIQKLNYLSNSALFKKYRFVICFENSFADEYITEKLPNVMFSGGIPIYRGAPNIGKYFNTESFINFENYGYYNK